MRTDYAPADAPFSEQDLARNFERIALHREYRFEGGRIVRDPRPTPLARWEGPIRYAVTGGSSADLAAIERFAARLSGVTGVAMTRLSKATGANLSLLILNEEERATLLEGLEAAAQTGMIPLAEDWARNPGRTCVGWFAFASSGAITGVTILVKDELRGVFREACFQEEMAQAMGLIQDDPRVRPSIFNDDQEFAYLTLHDEYLLRILYHPVMRAGMTPEEARAAVPAAIVALRPGA